MDKRSRKIIHDYKPILSQTISYEKIESLVKEYKIFTKVMFDDIFGLTIGHKRDFYDELCTRGPDAFQKFLKILRIAGYYEIADDLQKKKNGEQVLRYYKMDSDPVGYCLIIMNEKFDFKKECRDGCTADAVELEKLFHKLNYDIQIEWNKDTNEMKSILKKFSEKSEFSNVDSCIVYISSHGNQRENKEYVTGVSSTCFDIIYKNDICDMFNNENCKLLIGKPKIFFFQSCRGNLLDEGVSKISSESAAKDDTDSQNSPDTANVSSLRFDKERKSPSKYPSCSDMFKVHSSLPYHQSWRNHRDGSWLCQDLVSVVDEYYDKYDFATLMTFVNSKQIDRKSEDGYKQIAHLEQVGVTSLLQFKRNNDEVTSTQTS